MAEKLRRRVRARMLAGLAHAAGFLPTDMTRIALQAASPLATWTKAEQRTRANLVLALGSTADAGTRNRIARRVRLHVARLAAEWLALARRGSPTDPRSRWIDELVQCDETVEILERERARGRGVIIATAHIGNWELLCARLARRGHNAGGAVIGFQRPSDSAYRWFERVRANYGVTTLAQHTPPREILRILKNGGAIGMLCDLEVRRLDGEFLPFFGVPALTMTAPAALARAARLPLVPARCVFDGERYRLTVDEPLALDPSLDKEAAQFDLLTRLNATYERWIRAAPEQWAWHQPRWRTRPGTTELVPLAEQRRRERARRIAAGKEVAPVHMDDENAHDGAASDSARRRA